jgi:GNAT superfamily N-acetyltransferase
MNAETDADAVVVRPAEIGDAGRVAALITELGYPTDGETMTERLAPILSDPHHLTLVAGSNGLIVGVAGATLGRYYEKDGNYARLLVLTVASTARGRGIGSQLVSAVERWAADNGVRDIVVNSALHRAEAHDFYERRGYLRTGFRFVKTLARPESVALT